MNHYPNPFPPRWAEAWGDDRFGLWAELQVSNVIQRMRWLAPGRFMMGSPDDEPGRSNIEGPQHWVALTHDLWLADTACTQALWQAVMGSGNPSPEQDRKNNPVEQVSWEDVQAFLTTLQRKHDLSARFDAVLPTEAQWEYACRAGIVSPSSFDQTMDKEMKSKRNTLPVKALPANAWGLYQMLGNVQEWCADALREYSATAQTNPCGETGNAVEFFALRGGNLNDPPTEARSALRNQKSRVERSYSVGFRFALRSTK